jgi:predicted ArsR family transcriptional regulator
MKSDLETLLGVVSDTGRSILLAACLEYEPGFEEVVARFGALVSRSEDRIRDEVRAGLDMLIQAKYVRPVGNQGEAASFRLTPAGSRASPRASYGLTMAVECKHSLQRILGKSVTDETEGPGNRYAIFMALAKQPRGLAKIAEETGLDKRRVREHLFMLERHGWVKYARRKRTDSNAPAYRWKGGASVGDLDAEAAPRYARRVAAFLGERQKDASAPDAPEGCVTVDEMVGYLGLARSTVANGVTYLMKGGFLIADSNWQNRAGVRLTAQGLRIRWKLYPLDPDFARGERQVRSAHKLLSDRADGAEYARLAYDLAKSQSSLAGRTFATPAQDALLEEMRERGGGSAADLAARLGKNVPAVFKQLRLLAAENVVEVGRGEGGKNVYALHP